MVRQLARVSLKSGERMHCLLIEEPEASWAEDVQRLLVHKRDHVHWHIARAIEGPLDELETRFYLGVVNGQAVGNIMTVEHDGIGILGHVFTSPEQRRKGIASHIMAAQMRDFQERGGRVLTLGTGFDSPPYWIYHGYGFRSIVEGSGAMWYWRQPEQAAELWRAPITGVASPLWQHWPLVNLLCIQPGGDRLRLAARRLWGPRNFEGDFTQYKRDLESEDSTIVSRVLENEAGLVVGFASLEDDPLWGGTAALLDLVMHPTAWHAAGDLLDALPLASRPIFAYADHDSSKNDVLRAHGFTQVASWPEWLPVGGELHGVNCWLRR
ncbi:MAG: GNAT family N-acetyltransferase [Chloroflexi bacterium]|nr:GNAT family N-acetyltransferase [Chloroflexota bacterium]